MEEAREGFNVKITDDELKGRYSNLLRITHTREEFILDFINLVPPQGIVTARVVASPGAPEADPSRPEREPGALREGLRRHPGGPEHDRGQQRALKLEPEVRPPDPNG